MTVALRKPSSPIAHRQPVASAQPGLPNLLVRWSHRLSTPIRHEPFIHTRPTRTMPTRYLSQSTRYSKSPTLAGDGGKPGNPPERPVLLPRIIFSYYKTRMFRIQLGRKGAIRSGWSYVISKCDTIGFPLAIHPPYPLLLGIGWTSCLA